MAPEPPFSEKVKEAAEKAGESIHGALDKLTGKHEPTPLEKAEKATKETADKVKKAVSG